MGNKVLIEDIEEVVEEPAGYGFQYIPGVVPVYESIDETVPGLIVVLPKGTIDPDSIAMFVPGEKDTPRPLFDLPENVDENLIKLISLHKKYLEDNTDFLSRTQGFFNYCYECLEALNKTKCGREVISFFLEEGRRVSINPAYSGNSVVGADKADSFPILVDRLLDSRSRFTGEDGLVALAHKKFKGEDEDTSLDLMAMFMNMQPLYSLFNKKNEFEEGFLDSKFKIKGVDLKDWFTRGDESKFAIHLQNAKDIPYDNVSTLDYTRLMAIVALESEFTAGKGNSSGVRFNVKTGGVNEERPAAVGLGHELIHAYWAASGRQLGKELYTPSTLLFEMKCVGLGPWANQEISENSLRAQWVAANSVVVNRRDLYDEPETDDNKGRQKIRSDARTI